MAYRIACPGKQDIVVDVMPMGKEMTGCTAYGLHPAFKVEQDTHIQVGVIGAFLAVTFFAWAILMHRSTPKARKLA
jgi:hypothetical protein